MTPWWRGALIYQIYPRSYQDTTGSGVGDLAGITQRLEHVASLGADAVWMSPVFVSPMADMGYDVANYVDIDPLFGTLADFDALLARAHELGLKLVIDQVLSHTAAAHPWFDESRRSRDDPKADWYVWAEPKPDGSPPNNWLSNFGGSAWEWEPRRQQYYLHNFLISQPDLNFHTPAVQDALLDTVRFWLERGVDGFRLDTVNFFVHDAALRDNPARPGAFDAPLWNPYGAQRHEFSKTRPENLAFIERLRALTDAYDDRVLIGEVGDEERSVATMAEYTRGDHRLHMAYSFELLDTRFSAAHLRQAIERFFDAASDGWPSWSFSNHDVIRHATRWAEHADVDVDAIARQCIALLCSLQGSIGIYQGEELGLPEAELTYQQLTDPPGLRFWPEYKGRDGCRTPMPWSAGAHAGFTDGTPWLPVTDAHRALDVGSQQDDANSLLNRYRRVIAFRQTSPALRLGSTRFLELSEPAFGFVREHGDERVMCLFNLSASPVRVTLDDASRWTSCGPSDGGELMADGIELGPNAAVFLHERD